MNTPSREALKTQAVIQQAVIEALDKKRKLGQYAVVWRDGAVVLLLPECDANKERSIFSH